MVWETDHTLETEASPEAVFAVWADVEGWPGWDASLVATTLDGPFAAGTTGTLHPQGMPEPVAFTITAVDEGAGFADETRLGPLVLRFTHRAEPHFGGARITVTIAAEGPDADQVGPAVAADLPESVAALAAAALGRTLPA
jgi:Polyketide cyclase / dehydrase and lipid transport